MRTQEGQGLHRGGGAAMTAKHTPGQWAYHNTPTPFIHVAAGGLPICEIYTSTAHGQSMGEQFANARLIAAAPELLEALAEVVNAADGEVWSQLDPSLSKARAAIAKALPNAAEKEAGE